MKKAVASLTMSLAFIVGCSTPEVATEDSKDSRGQEEVVTLPSESKSTTVISSYFVNDYFKVAVPESWSVVSYEGPELPSHVSLEKKDSRALVTIRVYKTDKSIDSICQDEAKRFVSLSKDIIQGPEIKGNTCTITADEESDNATLWVSKYDDDNSVYSIYFEGDIDEVNEILGRLEGNKKIMSLLTMPLPETN